MLINLLPDFFSVLSSADRTAAYLRYYETHQRILHAYWHNYVVDPETPHFRDVVHATVRPDRTDLRQALERVDVVSLARTVEQRCTSLFEIDEDYDIVLMVGVGAANAGELVVDNRGIAFVCLEHFTGVANPTTQGLGLDPELISPWLAHEVAHLVRYTSSKSRSALRAIIRDDGGYYSYWESGRQASLRELLINEGLAVHASQLASPGHAIWEYFGYSRRHYARAKAMDSVIARAVVEDLDHHGLGLRLRYLSGGTSDEARTWNGNTLPERSGYYIGARMTEAAVKNRGIAWALRADAHEITAASGGGEAIASA